MLKTSCRLPNLFPRALNYCSRFCAQIVALALINCGTYGQLSQSCGSVPAVLVPLRQDMTLCDTLRRDLGKKTSGAAGTCRPRLEVFRAGQKKLRNLTKMWIRFMHVLSGAREMFFRVNVRAALYGKKLRNCITSLRARTHSHTQTHVRVYIHSHKWGS